MDVSQFSRRGSAGENISNTRIKDASVEVTSRAAITEQSERQATSYRMLAEAS
jgi:hypothetical protein